MKVVRLSPGTPFAQPWSPNIARRLGLRYILDMHRIKLDALLRADITAQVDDYLDLDAVLVNLYEPLFTYPVVLGRLKLMRQIECPGRILDYGCGAGYYAIALALAGHEVDCWDTNPVAQNSIEYVAGALGLQARQSTLSNNYDAALCINVLDHITEPEECLEMIAAALVTDAPLYLHADFNPDGVHVSGPKAVTRCFRAIATRFAPAHQSDLVQVWHRRPAISADGDGLLPDAARLSDPDLRPVMNSVVALEHSDDGGTVVTGRIFYIRPCKLARPAAQILAACDGKMTMRELGAKQQPAMMEADLRHVVAQLWERRIIFMRGQIP